jgi:hypothetical protein
MKIIVALFTLLLLAGCSIHHYQPPQITIRDSYNTYAPVYAPVYSPTTTSNTVPKVAKKMPMKRTIRIIPNGGAR